MGDACSSARYNPEAMTAAIIQFSHSTVTDISLQGDLATVRFDPAMVVKSEDIPLVDASTLWTQAGGITIQEAETEGQIPELPVVLTGGSLEARGYKTVDMIQMPLEDVQGYVELVLEFPQGGTFSVKGTVVSLAMDDVPKYVRHLED